MINVRDPMLGAVGDGVVDDTFAIQTAIDMACGPGDPAQTVRTAKDSVYLPGGTYRITQPLRVESVIGFKFFGEGMWMTRLSASGQLPYVLDLNGVFGSQFSEFTIRSKDGGNVDTFDAGIYYHWDATRSKFIASDNRFSHINVENGKFKTGFQIGSWRHLNLGVQEDQTYWYGCRVSGKWTPGENTWWQHGFNVGSGKFANNLIHNFYGLHATHCRNGVTVDASQAMTLGGILQSNECDINLLGVIAPCIFRGFRSEKSGRLVQTAGPVTWAAKATLEDIQWRITSSMAADKRVIFWRFPGHLALRNVDISGEESANPAPVPKAYFAGNKFAAPIAHLAVSIDGLNVGGGQTIQNFFEYEPESTHLFARGVTQLRPGGGSGPFIPYASTVANGPPSSWVAL